MLEGSATRKTFSTTQPRSAKAVSLVALFACLLSCSSTQEGEPPGDGDTNSGGMESYLGSGGSAGPGAGGTEQVGDSGGATGDGDISSAGGTDPGSGGNLGSGGSGNHAPRSLGYVGCSMSDNVASGYAAVGGERMWPSIPAYWGQVVQDWANPSDEVWNAFDAQVEMYGAPSAVWIMVCIFNPPGVELQEMRDIIGLVRERSPEATIYITGQPFYEPGAGCSIAGEEGPQLTDDMARDVAQDATLSDVIYVGKFGPLSAAQKADTCHANEAGRELLGEQALEFFGD